MLKNFINQSFFKSVNQVFNPSYGIVQQRTFYSKTMGEWDEYNRKIYPPQEPNEPPRPAYVCLYKKNIKYSPEKLWYVACLVRGMSVDEALKQLQFVQKKGAAIVREVILQAQKKAVQEFNVEFKSNLWVSESIAEKGETIFGLRRIAHCNLSRIRYRHSTYFVILEEGKPPEHYYHFKRQKTAEELLDEYLKRMRNRKIIKSL